MTKKYDVILKSILSKTELENVDEIEKECTSDLKLENYLFKKNCIYVFGWADGFESLGDFSSFVKKRLEVLAGLDFEFPDESYFRDLMQDKLNKRGDFVPLLIKLCNQLLEKYGFTFVVIPSCDDAYRICIAKHSYYSKLSQIRLESERFSTFVL